jgi:epoxyqueuosine reductase QueG
MDVAKIVAASLAGSGIELVGAAPVDGWDGRAPSALRASSLLAGARSVVVVASAGPALFRRFAAAPTTGDHPLDAFVARELDRVDASLRARGVAFRRFEPTFSFRPALDFRTLGEIVGLGHVGPFGLLVHRVHGPWIALRGAWLVDVETSAPPIARSPCEGCARPCVEGEALPVALDRSTARMRLRCIVGTTSRYDDAQIAFHYEKSC